MNVGVLLRIEPQHWDTTNSHALNPRLWLRRRNQRRHFTSKTSSRMVKPVRLSSMQSSNVLPCAELTRVLRSAYDPCPSFSSVCKPQAEPAREEGASIWKRVSNFQMLAPSSRAGSA